MFRSLLAGTGLLALTALAQALPVDYDHFSAEELHVDDIEAVVGVSTNTQNIDGVALGPVGQLYAIHRTSTTAEETIILLEEVNGETTGSVIKSQAGLLGELGAPFTSLILEGGFVTDPQRRRAYFAESASGEYAILRLELTSAAKAAGVVLRSPALEGISDFDILPTGQLVIARGAEGVGIVDPNAPTPTHTAKFSEDDFKAALGGVLEAPPESIAVHPRTGEVYIFTHDELEIFRVSNILATNPVLERVVIPGWTGVVDLHDMAVDQEGTLYGWDEGRGYLVIWDGTATWEHPVGELFEAAEGHGHAHGSGGLQPKDAGHDHGADGLTNWRGLAVRRKNSSQAEVLLASATADHGIVKVTFGDAPQVNFNTFTVEELHVDEIEALPGYTSNTQNIDGVALGAGNDLFAIHRNTAAGETFLRFDATNVETTGEILKTTASIVTDLGGPFTDLILEAGLATSPAGDRLYFGDSFSGEYSLLQLNLTAPGAPASVVLRSADLTDMSDFTVLPSRELVVVRGPDGMGVVNPEATTPAYSGKFDEADFIAAFGSGPEAPPESVAAHPYTGETFIFAHDILQMFRAPHILADTPELEHLAIPGWDGAVDLHDLVVDEDGTLYGWDEGLTRIAIWDGTQAVFHDLDEFLEGHTHGAGLRPKHTGPEGLTNWRGLAVRKLNATQAELWLANGTPEHGLIRVVFGTSGAPNAAAHWSQYE